jgi:hypothetical protein
MTAFRHAAGLVPVAADRENDLGAARSVLATEAAGPA